MVSLLSVTHLIGLALAVGAATVKLVLLGKCRAEPAFAVIYSKVTRLITRQIIVGLALMTLSGIGWLLAGYPFTPRLIVKLVLVAGIWVVGPVIDNLVEPKFNAALVSGEAPSPAFLAIQKQYLTLEVIATLLFYVIIVLWVWR